MFLDKLHQDLNSSLKRHDKMRVDTLRFLIAAVKKFEIDTYPPGSKGSLTDEDVLRLIRHQVKTHEESIVAFEKGGRVDLVEKEKAELAILKFYLPQELSDVEIRKIVASVKTTEVVNFGALIGAVMKLVAGRASGERVARIVKEHLDS